MRFTREAINEQQNPWNVRDSRDEIDVNKMKKVVPAESEDHRAEPARFAREAKSFEQQHDTREHRRVAADDFNVERGGQRQKSIQQPVPRVRHADLAFAEEVVAAKDRRRPQYRVAVAKGVRIEIAHRKMVGAEIIERAVDTIRFAANAKHIELSVNWSSREVVVKGDAQRLQQVVLNLLSNAVKFTPDRGRVCVTLEKSRTDARIFVSDGTSARRAAGARVATSRGKPLARVGAGFAPV